MNHSKSLLVIFSTKIISKYLFCLSSYDKEAFGFGTATAAYQIEGAYNEDGKGLNIWDEWSNREPNDLGRCGIARCETGNIACDSYHNVDRDVDYVKSLNLDQYRFSLSWARLLPSGYVSDGVNQARNSLQVF